ncbi:MAG: ABC transporter ATP-binding protein [Polaromonas sp.]|nr:MAG: ABC transporter ATP-binding protein [Polaromonas sp.]
MNKPASLPLDKGSPSEPLLVVKGLDVFYGRAHAVQSISFGLSEGVLGIVGRNGMGKTSLCNAITGLVPARGSIRFAGQEILGLSPDKITRRGIAYVPQGRRMWPSLTVDETLCLVGRTRHEVQEMYELFPRLAERKGNGSTQLSGGEQQMLAIARALLLRPRLLVMDEPTEGLAPVIVDHVVEIMHSLAADKGLAILLIEQNLGVALGVSDDIGVMVNGQIAHQMPASVLAADRDLQERLLGLRSADSDSDGGVNAQPTHTGGEESRDSAGARSAG